jgi:hypothetical protein
MWFTRVVSSAIWLSAVVFTIPLAFDIGGRTCGLAFSLALSSFYFLYSILRLATPDDSRVRYTFRELIRWSQWIVIPTLLIWSLNKFSVDSDNSSGWVERSFGGKRAEDTSIHEWIFGRDGLVQNITVGGWDKLLWYSTPVFQILEGFCSLLVIQAAGQITRWLVNSRERGDSWMVRLLLGSYMQLADFFPDRSPDNLCLNILNLHLLPMAYHHLSRDRQCRRHSHRCSSRYYCIPLRMGDRKWARQSGGIVVTRMLALSFNSANADIISLPMLLSVSTRFSPITSPRRTPLLQQPNNPRFLRSLPSSWLPILPFCTP